MFIDLQFVLFLVIALWIGCTEMILGFFGYEFEKMSFLFLLLLWIGMIIVASVVFILIFRAFKIFFKFLLKQAQ